MIALAALNRHIEATIPLPSSKSESNRALIIQALAGTGIELTNLSEARDTRTMIKLLESEGHVLDVIDAGTTMRFLTAYCAASGRDQILTGTPRMCKRPIGILVEALRKLGAKIEYWKQEGFPPLHIVSQGGQLMGGELQMAGNVSSQFISAILMIAPTLPGGLRLSLEGAVTSRPYIDMTRSLMAHFSVETHWEEQSIVIPQKPYEGRAYQIESDWSAASYWYSIAALADSCDIRLTGLRESSWQGDRQIADIMHHFGVVSTFDETGVRLQKRSDWQPPQTEISIDFTAVPDLAQTIAVISAASGIPVYMTGLHTLRVKETDRIDALKNELAKLNVAVEVTAEDHIRINQQIQPKAIAVETYDDHRMAMAFAPLALRVPELSFQEPDVVQKSYPSFWMHLKMAGFRVNEW